jgi:ectoine hydroxylase-related dioxygenase (phytanoyl-CoA dioxygenase family)
VRFLRSLLHPRATTRLHAASSAQIEPTQGLVHIDYEVVPATSGAAVLEVHIDGSAVPALTKPLALEAGSSIQDWVALHSHLLRNGPHEVRLRLARHGAALGECSITVLVDNVGPLADWIRDRLAARGSPLVLAEACDSTLYDYADPTGTAWFDQSPDVVEAHLQALAESGDADASEVTALRHFAEHGYLTVAGAVDAAHLAQLNAALDDAVARKIQGYDWGSSQRLQNLHDDYPAIRQLWTHPRVLRMLSLIFGVPAKPCQTLSYVFGSQQQHHQDTIHLTPYPAGRMCGVWTALEDVREGSGELVVFPGSHRLPRVYMAGSGAPKVTDDDWTRFGEVIVPIWTRMINEAGLGPEPYRAKAGDVLIWHENLMHAGMPRSDMALSRRSIVGHYFAEGAIAYYDSSGRPGMTHPV